MNRKELAIELLEIADINLLMSIKGLNPKNLTKQIHHETNPISWIFGHCVRHMDFNLSLLTGTRKMSQEQHEYFSLGVDKEIIRKGFPFSFKEIVEIYLELSRIYFDKINNLSTNELNSIPSELSKAETILETIYRISLHYMSHQGQIVMIRVALEGPNWIFVGGILSSKRDELMREWLKWWEKNKRDFN